MQKGHTHSRAPSLFLEPTHRLNAENRCSSRKSNQSDIVFADIAIDATTQPEQERTPMPSDSAGQAVAIAWKQETAEAPCTRRDSMGWAVFQDKMWFLGGFIPTRVNDVWSSSDGVNWEEATPAAPWAARNLPCTLVYDDKLWIFAGADNPHVSYNDVWCSADGKHWEAATLDAPWGKRSAASAVIFDGRMWLFGGFDIAKFHHYQDVWTSTDGKNWDLVEEHAPWSARSMQTSVVFDGKMWLMGGGVYNTNYPNNTVVNHNDVWCTTDGKTWEMVAVAAAWQERRFHASAVYDDKMWIIGGHTHGNRNDVWFSADGANWVEAVGDPIWPIRHAPVCLTYRDKLWLIGGFGDTLYNDVWSYQR